jgi:hypothetical protein
LARWRISTDSKHGSPAQNFGDHCAKRLRSGGTADPTSLPLAAKVDVRDRRLSVDALNASTRDAGESGHLVLAVTGSSKNLDFVPLEHVDHPFPRC